MNCPTKRNEDAGILLDYCAQTLSRRQAEEFENHLKQCADCSRVVEAQKDVWGALETWTPVPVSVNFDARLYARIAGEQAAPAWRTWLLRILRPPVPYPLWKSAVPLAVACAVLALGLSVRTTDAANAGKPQLRADKVDIEQVEQTLEDFDILTPALQAPTGSM